LKYSAKAELVETVSTGIAQSKKQASCPCPGRCRSTDRTLSTPTVWSILARSMIGSNRQDEDEDENKDEDEGKDEDENEVKRKGHGKEGKVEGGRMIELSASEEVKLSEVK
jgi:hypothetical protein